MSVNFIRPPGAGGTGGFASLAESTWLVENCRHLRDVHRHSREKLHLLLVGRPDLIPAPVLEELAGTFVVHDESKAYDALVAEFPRIMGFFGGPYTVFGFGFLRWLLIERAFGGEPTLCYDGDIVHNVPLDDLSKAFRGLTRTATSTCFASIADPEWFRAWRRHLRHFDADVADFLERHLPRLAYGFDQFKSSPEEYFAKFLIEAGELPQQDAGADFPYWIVPQPQLLPRLFNFVRAEGAEYIPTPMTYSRVDGIDRINGRPVAFWHMQKPFMSQLSALAMVSGAAPSDDPGAIPPLLFYGRRPSPADYLMNDPYHHLGGTPLVPWRLYGLTDWLQKQAQAMRPLAVDSNPFHPAFLYDHYFRQHDFSLLFNPERWPAADAWVA